MNLMQSIERLVVAGLGAAPEVVQSAIGGRRTNRDGDVLEPEVAAALRLLNAMPDADFSKTDDLARSREQIDHEAVLFGGSPLPMATVEEIVIPGPGGQVPARRYVARDGDQQRLLVFFHGGGWVLGSLDSHDATCRFLAHHAGVSVLSVGYRLAPEYPFPAASDDALAAFGYAVEMAPAWGHDPELIGVAGDSAGGNLAAGLCHDLRGEPVQPALQVLFYPVTDMTVERPSYDEFAEGYFLTRDQMDWYKDRYFRNFGADPADPRLSPLLAGDFADLPPAHVVTAGFDPLRDEGEEYAAALGAAGVAVSLRRHRGLIHGFVNSVGVGQASAAAMREACGVIRHGLRRH